MIGGLSLAALPRQSLAQQQPPAFATGAIDIHHHFVPPNLEGLVKGWLDRFAPVGWTTWTPEASLQSMAMARVDESILSISAPGTFFGDAAQARRVSRECNDYAAALSNSHPGRFSFFAALPMPDIEGSIREAERTAALPHVRGVGLLSNYGGRYLGDRAFRPLFDALGERGGLVYIHPTSAPCCAGLVPDVPDRLIEFPVDTARTISSLLWSGVLSAYPKLRFIFSHGGGATAMVMERIASVGLFRKDLAALVPEGPMAALARIYVDTASTATNPAGMAAVQAWLPSEHILYGTDFPYGDQVRARSALARLGLAAPVLAGIERGNAERLFAT